MPAVYEHPEAGELGATLYFNWLWRAAAAVVKVPQKDGSYVMAQIEPKPDAHIHLLMETLPDQGEMTYVHSGTLKWKDGLTRIMDLVTPGEHEVVLSRTLYKPTGKDLYPGMSIVEVIQRGGLPLIRQYILDAEMFTEKRFGQKMS